MPTKPGIYTVNINYGGQPVPPSPFRVEVARSIDAKESRIRAFGPGLHSGVVGQPARFTVDTNGQSTPTLKFFIEGPQETRIDCDDKQDGSVDVTYWPTAPGTASFLIFKYIACNFLSI